MDEAKVCLLHQGACPGSLGAVPAPGSSALSSCGEVASLGADVALSPASCAFWVPVESVGAKQSLCAAAWPAGLVATPCSPFHFL